MISINYKPAGQFEETRYDKIYKRLINTINLVSQTIQH